MSRHPAPDSLYVKVRDFLAKNDARGWRTSQIAEKLNEPATRVSTVLAQLHEAGSLSRCELTGPGHGRDRFEYRAKGYVKPDDFKPLKPAKPTIVGRAPAAPTAHKDIANPPRAEASMAAGSAPETRAPAASAGEHQRNQGERFAPGNGAKQTIDREPEITRTAAFAISDDGCLGITFDDCTVTLPPVDLVAMMAFLDKTSALWR